MVLNSKPMINNPSSLPTCAGLPKPPEVKEAVEGPDGVLAGLGRGKVWLEHSTTDSKQSQGFAKIAEEKGTRWRSKHFSTESSPILT